jgi:hypothetical protein
MGRHHIDHNCSASVHVNNSAGRRERGLHSEVGLIQRSTGSHVNLNSDLSPYAYVLPELLFRGSLTANWRSAPRPWPIFAEYTGNGSADGSLGYSDTGFMMRALLPFSDTRSRSFIHTYEGPAPVVDARTICIRPNITNTRILPNNTAPLYDLKIHGNISVPDGLLPVLLAETPFADFEPTAFACEPSWNFIRDYGQDKVAGRTSAWDLTVCDFGPSAQAKLQANFWKNFSSPITPFLLINYTGYVDQQVQNNTNFPPLKLANFNDTTPGLRYHDRNEWLDLKQDADILDRSDGNNFADTKLSFSLCLPTFHAYVFNISASSQAPLEEPTFFYDAERSQFRYDNIRKQLVSSSTLSLQERNVLSLHPQSWLLFNNMTNQDYPFGNIDTMITLTGSNQIFVPGQEHPTVHLMDDAKELTPRADRNIEGLGLEILQEGGTPAEAMQSILMSVVLADYQSYVFTEVPDGTPNSTVTLRGDFVTAQVPGGNGRPATNPAGATRSYVIVMIATAVHSVAVFLVFMLFIRSTKNTLIWESWHTIAQSMSAVTEPYLSQAGLATDSEVKKQMKTDGTSNQAVSVKTDESGARAEVGVVRQRVKDKRIQKDSQSDLLMEELRPVRPARNVERWNDRDTTNI